MYLALTDGVSLPKFNEDGEEKKVVQRREVNMKKLSEDKIIAIIRLKEEGVSVRKIAEKMGMSHTTVQKYISKGAQEVTKEVSRGGKTSLTKDKSKNSREVKKEGEMNVTPIINESEEIHEQTESEEIERDDTELAIGGTLDADSFKNFNREYEKAIEERKKKEERRMEQEMEEKIERIEEEIIIEANEKLSDPEELIGEDEVVSDQIEIASEGAEEATPAKNEMESVGRIRGSNITEYHEYPKKHDGTDEPDEMESIDEFEKEYQKSFKEIEDSANGKKVKGMEKVDGEEKRSDDGNGGKSKSKSKGKKKKALIVYYSQTRRTETAAFKILATLCRKRNEDPDDELASIRRQIEEQGANVRKIESDSADIIRVENLEDHGFLENVVNGFIKKKYRITVPHVNYNDYDLVFIGCPVWGGKPASPMMAYLASPLIKKKLRGKKVAPFVTCWLSVGGKAALGGMNHLLSDVKCDVIGGAAIDSLETHLGKKELTRVRQFCLVALKMATS